MNVCCLFIISALLVVNSSSCDHYIDCFTEFLHEFFTKNSTDDGKIEGDKIHQKVIDLDEQKEVFDKIIDDLTGLIKDVNVNIKEHITKKSENNKTKIHIKVFEFGELLNNFSTESTAVTDEHESTTEDTLSDLLEDFIKLPSILLNNANLLPFETTTQRLNIVPLQNDIDNEIVNKYDFYDDLDDNSTDYPGIDYLELYKDTTNEDVDFIPTEAPVHLGEAVQQNEQDLENLIEESLNLIQDEFLHSLLKNITNRTIESCNGDKLLLSSAVFPWIATIFLKNESKGDQFDYFCDGALISEKIVLTAARCVFNNDSVINPENLLVILGKTSLQVSSGNENILKVSSIKPHGNFTVINNTASNDLAMLVLEDRVTSNEGIATACLVKNATEDDNVTEAVTTAWSLPGDLTLVYFDQGKSKACGSSNKAENTFCATYGNDVALCPSFGGLYVTISPDHQVLLQGLRTGNPHDRGICYDKNITYTSLNSYHKWIQDVSDANK